MSGGTPVRRARAADAPAIDEVRVAGWQSAYRGIVEDAYLDAMRPDARRFAASLREENGIAHYVAEFDAVVVGWACVGPARDVDAPAGVWEVYACYVRPAQWRGGIGKALLEAALAPAGDPAPVLLWVLAANAGARTFYERHGFAPDGAERDTRLDRPVDHPPREVRYRRAGRVPA